MTENFGQDRIREIDETLEVLRREQGPPTGDPQDYGDAAADMVAREEQRARIEQLEEERRRLLGEL
jgi:hypothetical protein